MTLTLATVVNSTSAGGSAQSDTDRGTYPLRVESWDTFTADVQSTIALELEQLGDRRQFIPLHQLFSKVNSSALSVSGGMQVRAAVIVSVVGLHRHPCSIVLCMLDGAVNAFTLCINCT